MTCEMWHVTQDTWHMTHDTWHMTHGMWNVTYDTWSGWTFSQNVSSPALTVWDRQCLEDSEQKDDSMNQWINLINNYLVTKVFIEQPQLHYACQLYRPLETALAKQALLLFSVTTLMGGSTNELCCWKNSAWLTDWIQLPTTVWTVVTGSDNL